MRIEPYYSSKELREIITLGDELCRRYPHSHFIGIGQSPAWIVESIRLRALKEANGADTDFLPFSYRIVTRGGRRENSEGDLVTSFRAMFPTNTQTKRKGIQKCLMACGLTPEIIVKNHKEKRIETTLIDFCATGCGMASALALLSSMAEKEGLLNEVQKAVNVQLYSNTHAETAYRAKIFPKQKHTFEINADERVYPWEIQFSKIRSNLRDRLWEGPDNVRLVPPYGPEKWDQAPQEMDKQLSQVQAIRFAMKDVLNELQLAPTFVPPTPENRDNSSLLSRLQGLLSFRR